MRAVVRTRLGGPEVLEVRDMEEPTVGDTNVLVRVRAFRPGDDVFGGTTEGTAFADLVVVPEDGTLATK